MTIPREIREYAAATPFFENWLRICQWLRENPVEEDANGWADLDALDSLLSHWPDARRMVPPYPSAASWLDDERYNYRFKIFRHLNLTGYAGGEYLGHVWRKLFADRAELQYIRHISLAHRGSECARWLGDSPHLRNVVAVNLRSCKIDPEVLEYLLTAPMFSKLQTLLLGNNPLGDDGLAMLLEEDALFELRVLELGHVGLSIDVVPLFTRCASLKKLELLHLEGVPLPSDALEKLKEALPNLRAIFTGPKINDERTLPPYHPDAAYPLPVPGPSLYRYKRELQNVDWKTLLDKEGFGVEQRLLTALSKMDISSELKGQEQRLTEILTQGDLFQVLKLIAVLAKCPGEEASALLRRCQSDQRHLVRVAAELALGASKEAI